MPAARIEGGTMAVGMTRHLPLGITTDDRRGAIRRRWRTLATTAAMCLVAAGGFLVAEKAYELLAAKPAYMPAVENSHVAGRTLADESASPAVTEVPPAPEPSGMGAPAPVSPSAAAAAVKPTKEAVAMPGAPTVPALTGQPPTPPTVLRGAGIKPR